ncbi:NFX1-type zinc finger-containing protein 1-like isoform X2 [Haliotis rufescens]|uniref:NFX1-type zinc finger-containing protein 1-like isoform X2 n=1 Tax=Haliotis rufescens TaxID=6454 RepID=UPI00201E91EC|nr:NFX1-type zinc finger-containing protein 1-like isoform X2 [Haliotis rufescens]
MEKKRTSSRDITSDERCVEPQPDEGDGKTEHNNDSDQGVRSVEDFNGRISDVERTGSWRVRRSSEAAIPRHVGFKDLKLHRDGKTGRERTDSARLGNWRDRGTVDVDMKQHVGFKEREVHREGKTEQDRVDSTGTGNWRGRGSQGADIKQHVGFKEREVHRDENTEQDGVDSTGTGSWRGRGSQGADIKQHVGFKEREVHREGKTEQDRVDSSGTGSWRGRGSQGADIKQHVGFKEREVHRDENTEQDRVDSTGTGSWRGRGSQGADIKQHVGFKEREVHRDENTGQDGVDSTGTGSWRGRGSQGADIKQHVGFKEREVHRDENTGQDGVDSTGTGSWRDRGSQGADIKQHVGFKEREVHRDENTGQDAVDSTRTGSWRDRGSQGEDIKQHVGFKEREVHRDENTGQDGVDSTRTGSWRDRGSQGADIKQHVGFKEREVHRDENTGQDAVDSTRTGSWRDRGSQGEDIKQHVGFKEREVHRDENTGQDGVDSTRTGSWRDRGSQGADTKQHVGFKEREVHTDGHTEQHEGLLTGIGRQRYENSPGLNLSLLKELKHKDPSTILLTLESRIHCLMKPNTLPPHVVYTVVSLIAKGIQNRKTASNNVINILLAIQESKFYEHVSHLLEQLDAKLVEKDKSQSFLKDLTIFLTELYTRLPHAFMKVKVLGLEKQLTLVTQNLQRKYNIVDDEIVYNLSQLQELKYSVLQTSKNSMTRKQEDREGEPPDDFRALSILPNAADIYPNEKLFLRKNKSVGGYRNLDHYLDVQFRLLREDFVGPLRDGIGALFAEKKPLKQGQRINDVRVYYDVHIGRKVLSHNGILHRLHFDVSGLKQIVWEDSKSLIYGTLVCLLLDNSETFILATIADRSPNLLGLGIVDAMIEDSGEFEIRRDMKFTMVETTAFFEAYRHVLGALQEVNEGDLPFEKYIVHCETSRDPPRYLRRCSRSSHYDLQPLTETQSILTDRHGMRRLTSQPALKVNIFDNGDWPTADALHLNTPQYQALKTALTKEFAIIQGPPGTGKTFIGLKIVKALLHNKAKWKKPMLIVCYTNHALDQFLEGIISFHKDNVIRVGSRISKTCLEVYSLKALRLKHRSKGMKHHRWELRQDMELFETCMEEAYMKLEDAKGSILHEATLLEYMHIHYDRMLEMMEIMHAELEVQLGQKLKFPRCVMREWLGMGNIVTGHLLQNEFADEYNENEEEKSEREDEEEGKGVEEGVEEEEEEAGKGVEEGVEEEEEEGKGVDGKGGVEEGEEGRGVDGKVVEEGEEREEEEEEEDGNTVDGAEMAESYKTNDCFADEGFATEEKSNDEIQGENNVTFVMSTVQNTSAANDYMHGFQFPKSKRKNMKQYVLRQLRSSERMTDDEFEHIGEPWNLSMHDRWRLYRYWVFKLCEKLKRQILLDEECYKNALTELKELQEDEDKLLFHNATVLGMTTTAAARNRQVLADIGPSIIVVEEAAQVLEGHIISTLSKKCEHLILIGDHKQLKPNPTVYKLAKQFNMDLSLFERMVSNGIHCDTLSLQHRMRPEISALLRHIYPNLEDDPSVFKYENVKGVSANMFFIDHRNQEEPDRHMVSHSNEYEAMYVVALCSYLLKQGYNNSQITVLTTYSGQQQKIKKLMRMGNFPDVKLTVVDNFQGEENDIVLLSLVRSNPENSVGFLKIENRICVALSRAKIGLFVIGNFELLAKQSLMWRDILVDLRKNNQVGPILNLYCQNHQGETGISIERPHDFKKAPDGGCLKPCLFRLKCGHVCTRFCHPYDPEHTEFLCMKSCNEILCGDGHPCPRPCHKQCGKCTVPIQKTIPSCGHRQMVPCFKDPNTFSCMEDCEILCTNGHQCPRPCHEQCGQCTVPIQKTIPSCDHRQMVPCFQDPNEFSCEDYCETDLDCGHRCGEVCGKAHQCTATIKKTFRCGHVKEVLCINKETAECCVRCIVKLDCGHSCDGNCNRCYEGRLHVPCRKMCQETLLCGHECGAKCSHCPPCKMACENRCLHKSCTKFCGEICDPCKAPCEWKCEHFKCTLTCYEPCDRPPCNEPCKKKLPCEHLCIGLCGEPCPTQCRFCNTDVVSRVSGKPGARYVFLEDCGHIAEVTSLDRHMESKSEEIKLKECPHCKTIIRHNVRYGNVINSTLRKLEVVKEQCNELEDKVLETEERMMIQVLNDEESEENTKELMLRQGFTNTVAGVTALRNQFSLLDELAKIADEYERFVGLEDIIRLIDLNSEEIKMFRTWLMIRRQAFGRQDESDAQNELLRHKMIIQLVDLEFLLGAKSKEIAICGYLLILKDILMSGKPYTAEKQIRVEGLFAQLRRILNNTIEEIDNTKVMIVPTTGIASGRWFFCRHGHTYSMGGRGYGSKHDCPSCGIGIGQKHDRRF